MSHKKFGPDRFSRFDVYWIQTDRQTDKQTNRQAKFIYRRELNPNSYFQIFATWSGKPLIFKTINYVLLNSLSLK